MQDEAQTPLLAQRSRRGRPRSFDLDATTAAALETFWQRGYETTTVEDLLGATGLSLSSFYAAFGSKRGALQAVLARYDRQADAVLAPLEHGAEGVEDVCRFLGEVRDAVAEGGTTGCLMVNTSTEVGPHDDEIAAQANRYRERVRDGATAALTRAVAHGELPAGTDALNRARIIQAAVYGALVAARGGARDEACATLDALMQSLREHRR